MITSIILAAGEGSRMKSKLPKCSHKVCGKALVNHIVESAEKAGVERNIVVTGHRAEVIEELVKDYSSVITVNQPVGPSDPYGTAFAVKQGIDYIREGDSVLILCGDTPLIRPETIKDFVQFHMEEGNDVTVLTSVLENPTGYGRIIRDKHNRVKKIVEQKDGSKEELTIKEINSGVYCFNSEQLKYVLEKIDNNNSQGEYYITDGIHLVNEKKGKVGAYIVEDSGEIQGINSKVQLAEVNGIMRKRINTNHMLNGVTLIHPENTYIGPDVEIGKDTLIYPGVFIDGKSKIGEDSIITSGSRIIESEIGNSVEIESSIIKNSIIGDETKIGPFAQLRPNSKIGKKVKIGNFVEVKNSLLKDGAKASHLTYIGDGEIGEDVNIGCGVVFVNYDGKNKNRTTVKDKAFVGCNVNLIAPVEVGEGAYIAAGSTITEDVSEYSLAIARERQIEKKNWVKLKKNK